MSLLVFATMPKRIKYFISSVLAGFIFLVLISLPYEARYYGLMAGGVLLVFIYWFGLGIILEESVYNKLVPVLLPLMLFIGFGLFSALLPFTWITGPVLSLAFGALCYTIFLVENIFFVAIGYKTVPLYRAAYTVSLMVVLLTAFFVFDSILSFKAHFLINTLAVFLASTVLFLYQFWAIAIELADDGKDKKKLFYVGVPALVVAELALIFSFWPVGIFKGSVYLVSAIYVISGLLQADIRDRLFRRTWRGLAWVGAAVFLAVIVMTKWGE